MSWNIDEEFYPGPADERLYLNEIRQGFEATDLPHLLKTGQIYFNKQGKPLGIITSIDYSDQTVTLNTQGYR